MKKVFKNFSYLTIGSVVSQFLTLVTVIKITNVLSPVNYGVYTFLISQGLLLHALSDLGLKNIIIRSIARNPETTNSIIINGSILRFITLIIFSIIYLFYNNLLGDLNSSQITFICSYGLVNSVYFLLEYVFIGNQKMLFPSVIKIIHSSIWFVTVFLLPIEYFNISNLLYIYLSISGIQIVLMFYNLRKLKLFTGKIKDLISSSKSLISESWPYIALMFLNLPFSHFANNFLHLNSTSDEIGFFNLAKKLMNPVQIIVTFSVTAIFPNISKLFSENKHRFIEIVKKGMPIFVLIIGYICFLYSLFSYDIISWFFSPDYLPAVRVAQLQIWFLFFNAINILITTVFGAANLEKKIIRVSLICSLIGTPLVYFGSYYGALGMSYGFIIGFTIFEFYIWNELKNNLDLKFSNEKSVWISIALLFMISYLVPLDFKIVYKTIITLFITVIIISIFKGNYLAFVKNEK